MLGKLTRVIKLTKKVGLIKVITMVNLYNNNMDKVDHKLHLNKIKDQQLPLKRVDIKHQTNKHMELQQKPHKKVLNMVVHREEVQEELTKPLRNLDRNWLQEEQEDSSECKNNSKLSMITTLVVLTCLSSERLLRISELT